MKGEGGGEKEVQDRVWYGRQIWAWVQKGEGHRGGQAGRRSVSENPAWTKTARRV